MKSYFKNYQLLMASNVANRLSIRIMILMLQLKKKKKILKLLKKLWKVRKRAFMFHPQKNLKNQKEKPGIQL